LVLLVCIDFFLRTCFFAGALSLSVSLCQYQFMQRGAVLTSRNELNHFFFRFVNCCQLKFVFFFIYLVSTFSLIKCGCCGLEVISFHSFDGGCRLSDRLGCNGLLEFLLGCCGLSGLSLFGGKLLRLIARLLGASVASRVSFGLQWPLEIVWLAQNTGCSSSIALFVGCFLRDYKKI
jgi:hypothetical protein